MNCSFTRSTVRRCFNQICTTNDQHHFISFQTFRSERRYEGILGLLFTERLKSHSFNMCAVSHMNNINEYCTNANRFSMKCDVIRSVTLCVRFVKSHFALMIMIRLHMTKTNTKSTHLKNSKPDHKTKPDNNRIAASNFWFDCFYLLFSCLYITGKQLARSINDIDPWT